MFSCRTLLALYGLSLDKWEDTQYNQISADLTELEIGKPLAVDFQILATTREGRKSITMVEEKQLPAKQEIRTGYRRNTVTGKQYDWNIRRTNEREVYQKKGAAYKKLKRLFDIVLSCVGLVVLSPVFLITAIAILIEDGRPVFFVQPRAGKDMKPFNFYKFRSMYNGADKKLAEMLAQSEQTGHAFKIKDDPRITKVGKFIRKYAIDELPQLVNIIKGDMSIVGPRPILTFQMEECSEFEQQRLIVQPGLTCYWQISGRSNIKWDEWVELDLDYIEDMSLLTDLKIIVGTIPAIFSGEGGY